MSCPGFSANFTNVSLVPHASQLVAVYHDSNWTELNEACNCTTFKSHTEDVSWHVVYVASYGYGYDARRYAQ